MIMKASALLISPSRLADLKANYFVYLDAALADANKGAPTHLATWFGALSGPQLTTLRNGLRKLKDVAQSYKADPAATKPTERIIEWTQVSGTDLHSTNQYAAAYPFGVPDLNKHFTLRIYSGLLLAKQTYDWVVNTMYH